MNFKLTKGKFIWNIIIGIVIDVLSWFVYYSLYPPNKPIGVNIFMILFNFVNLIIFLIILAIIYVVWSIAQKK